MTKSIVGCLFDNLPPYALDPPIEAVVFGWGVSEDGQLGLDTDSSILAPKVVEALLGTRLRGRAFGRSPLVAGSRNTLAISADGEIYSWGWNARATLGHGHRDPVTKPQRIAGLRGHGIVQVALGGWHALALDAEGCVYAWGGNEYNQCAVDAAQRDVVLPTRCVPDLRVCQVAAGGMHSLALTESGQIWMWGEPWGDFSMTIDRSPRRIDTTSSFVRIVCGAFHNLALDESGQVWSWGINDFGQLGNGTTSYATAPQRITEGLEGVHIADIAAGGWHSLAISAEGEVYIWGRGEYGRLGLGDKSGSSKLRPTKIASLEGLKVVEASCGGTHSMVVTEDGRAFIWGRGGLGRLGTGDEKDRYSPVEVKLPGGPERWRAISVAAGGRHSLVLALPDNGDLEARQSGWLARRSPVGLSPQPSGVHMPLPPSAAAVARAWAAAAEPETAAEADDEGGGDDKDAADSSDGEEEPSAGKLVEAGEPVSESIEQAVDELTGLNVVEGAPGNAPHHSSEGNGGRNAVGDDDDSSVAAARREAAEEEGRREVRETQARAAGESPRLTGTSEGGDDYEEGGSDSETAENGGGRIMRMQSLAAATVHGLRDDLLGDRG